MKQFAFAFALVVLAGPAVAATDLSTPGTPGGPIIVPDLEVCFSQPMTAAMSAVSSEVITATNLVSAVANDFTFATDRKIIHARWWGQYYNYSANMPDARTFNLFWYYGFGNCTAFPEPPFCTFVVPNNAGEALVVAPAVFEYNVDLNLDCCFGAGYQFWFVAQCGPHRELTGAGQWGRKGTSPVLGCESMFRSAYFGFPNWIPMSQIVPPSQYADASQEFTCGDCGVTPTDATTWGTIKTLYQ